MQCPSLWLSNTNPCTCAFVAFACVSSWDIGNKVLSDTFQSHQVGVGLGTKSKALLKWQIAFPHMTSTKVSLEHCAMLARKLPKVLSSHCAPWWVPDRVKAKDVKDTVTYCLNLQYVLVLCWKRTQILLSSGVKHQSSTTSLVCHLSVNNLHQLKSSKHGPSNTSINLRHFTGAQCTVYKVQGRSYTYLSASTNKHRHNIRNKSNQTSPNDQRLHPRQQWNTGLGGSKDWGLVQGLLHWDLRQVTTIWRPWFNCTKSRKGGNRVLLICQRSVRGKDKDLWK